MILELPFLAGAVRLKSECLNGDRLLEHLARILKLEFGKISVSDSEPVAVISSQPPSDGNWIPWGGEARIPGNVYWDPESVRFHFQLPDEIEFWTRADLTWRTLIRLYHSCASNRIVKTDSLLMHGALLVSQGRGVVLFAGCGVGKSTACGRFERGGGRVLGDDKMMVHLREDGRVFAQPSPTWSRPIFAPEMQFDFRESVELAELFNLTRGEGDRIEPCQSIRWHGELLNSSINYFERPMEWMDKSLRCMVVKRNFTLTDRLWKKYRPLQINGDLNGSLAKNIDDWLNKGERK